VRGRKWEGEKRRRWEGERVRGRKWECGLRPLEDIGAYAPEGRRKKEHGAEGMGQRAWRIVGRAEGERAEVGMRNAASGP
jgi:hypothetical protein